ncbi:MAG: folate-binding protein [Burkholderiales bacterium]|nr:folate-binding protein [Burkholderiales bacterium]
MHTDWQDFLSARGAVPGPAPGWTASFGDPEGERAAAAAAAVLCDLSHLGVIGFSGDDAQVFLQGQLTCDVREATATASRPGALCTPKGRALATFRLWQDASGYCMQLPDGRLEAVRKRLSMYVLRSRVKVSDRSGDTVRLGVAGPRAAEGIAGALGLAPDALPGAGSIMPTGAMQLLCLGTSRFELVAPREQGPRLWALLAAVAMPAGEPAWRWASIMSGEALLHEATQDQFVPQMLDLDLTDGIGFSKGCYTGQEIVARTQYLGRLKQRLYLGHVDLPMAGDAGLPVPGTLLYSADMDGQSTGMVVDSALAPGGGIDLLAVVRTESAAAGAVHVGSIAGPAFLRLARAHPDSPAGQAG